MWKWLLTHDTFLPALSCSAGDTGRQGSELIKLLAPIYLFFGFRVLHRPDVSHEKRTRSYKTK